MRTSIYLTWLFIVLLLPLAAIGQPEVVAGDNELTRLGMQLRDPDPAVRLQAIETLGENHDSRAAGWLVTALRDTEAQVRAAAARGLSNRQHLPATPELLPLLDDPDETVRAPAAQALGAHRNWEAVEPLLKALTDPAPAVRVGAVTGLSRIHAAWTLDGMFAALADPDPKVRGAAARALSDLSQPQNWYTAVDTQLFTYNSDNAKELQTRVKDNLQALLKDENADVRANTAIALAKFPNAPLTPELLEAVKNPDPAIRRDALQMIGQDQASDPRCIDLCLTVLKDERDAEVREALLWRLGLSQDRRAVEPVLAALADAEPKVQARAIWALGWIGDPKAAEAVLPFLRDDDKQVRAEAALAAGKLGDPRAVEPLLLGLRDDFELVRQYAVSSLGSLRDRRATQPIIELLPDAQGEMLRSCIMALGSIGDPAAIEPLLAIGDQAPEIRRRLLDSLSRFSDPRTVPPLIAAIQDPDASVRQTAAACLGRLVSVCTEEQMRLLLGAEDAGVRRAVLAGMSRADNAVRFIELIIAALRDVDADVRQAAIDCLRRTPDKKAAVSLLALVKDDPQAKIRAAAAEVLLQIERNNTELLLTLINHRDEAVRKIGIIHADNHTDPRVTQALLTAVKDANSELRAAAAGNLGNRPGTQVFDALLTAMKDPDPTVRTQAIGSLSRNQDNRVIAPLLAAMKDLDEWARAGAIRALAWCRQPEVTEAMAQALGDENAVVVRAAATVLGERAEPRAVEILLAMLQEPDRDTSRNAANALRYYRDPQITGLLVDRLKAEVVADDLELLSTITRRGLAGLIMQLGSISLPGNIAAMLQSSGAPALAELEGMLRDEQPVTRAAAAAVMMQIRDARCIPALTGALADDSPRVRRAALRGLRVLADIRQMPHITPLLRDPDTTVRAEAILALGELQDTRALDLLLPLLLDPDADIRFVTAYALGRIGDAGAVPALPTALAKEPDAGVRRQIIDTLGLIGDPRAGDALLACLRDDDRQVAATAATALGLLQDRRAVEPLIAPARQPVNPPANRAGYQPFRLDGSIRALGLETGSSSNSANAIQMQQAVTMRSYYDPLQLQAITALGMIGDARAIEPLSMLMKERDTVISIMAGRALAQINDRKATELLLGFLTEKEATYRNNIITGLGITRPEPEVIGIFLAALRDGDAKRRGLAVQFFVALAASQAIGWDKIPQIKPGYREPRAVEPLIALLQDDDAQIRAGAARVLSCLEAPVTLQMITPLLSTADASACIDAITALSRNGDQAVADLLSLLKHERSDVRYAALYVIGYYRVTGAADALAALLNDPDAGMRWRAAEALGLIGDPRVADALLALRDDPQVPDADSNRNVPGRIINALKRLDDPRVTDVLLAEFAKTEGGGMQGGYGLLLYSTDARAADIVANGLNAGDDPACHLALDSLYGYMVSSLSQHEPAPSVLADRRIVAALIALLRDPRPNTPQVPMTYRPSYDQPLARKAAFILGELGDPQAVEPLIEALEYGDPIFRMTAADALGKLKDRRAVEPLIGALEHFGKEGRTYAARALASITSEDFGEDAGKWRAWWVEWE